MEKYSGSGVTLPGSREVTVFVTIDRNLVRQLDLDKLKIGIILVRVRSNMLACYQPLFDELRFAAEQVKPGNVIVVPKGSLYER